VEYARRGGLSSLTLNFFVSIASPRWACERPLIVRILARSVSIVQIL
jgi:hypothetical protein